MSAVVISTTNTATYPQGGGHFWVYRQYLEGLRLLGCDVHWLEVCAAAGDPAEDARLAAAFARRMEACGLADRFVLIFAGASRDAAPRRSYHGLARAQAEEVFRRADLLLNFHYAVEPRRFGDFRRTALVDIDPGLLQHWIAHGELRVAPHDVHLTTGETVGVPGSFVPDCGLAWQRIRPPVCLELWPFQSQDGPAPFSTVSNWWGDEWVTDGDGYYENNKRVSFLEFLELPRRTGQGLELALNLGEAPADLSLRDFLEGHGWRVRRASEVAGTPEDYQRYIQASRGEFGCAKPSCMRLRTAWVSDRTLCYLASGKPAVVQDTGPSAYLPEGRGLLRFTTVEEAAEAIAAVNADYARHSRAAREIAEACFDAKAVCARVLELALGAGREVHGG